MSILYTISRDFTSKEAVNGSGHWHPARLEQCGRKCIIEHFHIPYHMQCWHLSKGLGRYMDVAGNGHWQAGQCNHWVLEQIGRKCIIEHFHIPHRMQCWPLSKEFGRYMDVAGSGHWEVRVESQKEIHISTGYHQNPPDAISESQGSFFFFYV